MAKYLDGTGLATLWNNVKTKVTRIEFGEYVGTGTAGYTTGKYNQLNFSSLPDVVIMLAMDNNANRGSTNYNVILGERDGAHALMWPKNLKTSWVSPHGFGDSGTSVGMRIGNTGIAWGDSTIGSSTNTSEIANAARQQFNTSGYVYYYMAIWGVDVGGIV